MMKKINSLFIIAIFITSVFGMATVSAYSNDKEVNVALIIGTSSDPAISGALSTLMMEIEDLIIYDFSTSGIENLSKIQITNLIVIGHGEEYGIYKGHELLVSWKQLGNVVDNLNIDNKVYFLNCNSENVESFVPENKIGFTFYNNIDAIAGALLIALKLKIDMGVVSFSIFNSIIQKIVKRVNDVKSNLQSALLLSHRSGLSGEEIGLSAASLFITMGVQAIFIWAIPWALNKYGTALKGALASKFSSIPYIGSKLASIIAGGSGSGGYVAKIKTILPYLTYILTKGVGAFTDAIKKVMKWYDWIVMGASLIASLAIIGSTSGVSLQLGIVAAAWPVWKVVRDILYNYGESNSVWQDYPFSLSWDVLGGW